VTFRIERCRYQVVPQRYLEQERAPGGAFVSMNRFSTLLG
jgi:hypothetical protein